MIPIKTTLTEERPPEVAQRKWRTLMREAHRRQGEHWHSEMLPRHFIRGASARYGYQSRTKAYQKRKARDYEKGKAKKRNTDLVYSGLLEDIMTRLATIRGFPTRATVVMTGPRYISMRPWKTNQPHKAQEVTAVTSEEADTLSEVLGDYVTTALDELREPKTTTTG